MSKIKTYAPGDIAEGNFKKRLSPIINSTLTTSEKNNIIMVMEQFNTIYPKFYTQDDINRFQNSTIQITAVEKVGSTKSSEFKTKKNDIRIDTNFTLSSGKKFSIGISFKKGTAQTVQSWSSIETWEYIFQVTKTKKHYLQNILKVLLKLTKNHAENTNNLFIGSTFHLSPLDNTYEKKYNDSNKIDRKLKKKILSEHSHQQSGDIDNTIHFQNLIDSIEEEKKLQYELNKYMNKILEKNELLFHTILFGDPKEQCLLYYSERDKIKNFHHLSDLFDDIGKELFICGTKNHIHSAIRKLTNKINVSERYVYPCSTSSNNSNQYLVVWNNDIHKKNYSISDNKNLLENAEPRKSFLTYYDFKKKYSEYPHYPEYLNFNKLQSFYKKNFNIKFKNIAIPSKDHKDLENDFYEVLHDDSISLREKIDHLIIGFSMRYFHLLKIIFTDEEYRKCIYQIDEFHYRYVKTNLNPTQSNLNTVIKFLRRILQIKYEKDIGDQNTNVGKTLVPKKRKKSDSDEINFSEIFEPLTEPLHKKKKLNKVE